MLACLLLATLAEGVGFSTLLPLLTLATQMGLNGQGPMISGKRGLGRMAAHGLGSLGFQPTIGVLCTIIICGMALKAGFLFLAQKQTGYTVAHVSTNLRLTLLRTVLAARWEYYIRQPLGNIANAFTSEASRAAESYLHATSIVALSIQTLLYISLATMISWQVTLAALTVGGLLSATFSHLVRATRSAGARQTAVLKTLLGQLMDVLYAVKPLKAMARESLVTPLLEDQTQQLNHAFQREVLSKETLRAVQDPLVMVVLTGGLYIALTRWALSLDAIIAMSLLFERTLSSLTKMQRQYQSLVSCESAFWSLRATIEHSAAAHEVVPNGPLPQLRHGITLDTVSLAYEGTAVLQNVSLRIPAKKITAIVGPSGAGKTSLVDAIIGLIRPDRGEILIDDVPLRDLDVRAWRWQVGYVPQELLLLHESVLTNVTMGDRTLTEAEVEAALRAANAWEFITALPEGLHTTVGERGSRFSGGQRQRIAIARALVHKPQLLILDEATAALDDDSEAAICTSVQKLRGAMTIVVISHRPGLLRIADVVYRVDEGTICQIDPTQPPPQKAAAFVVAR